MNELIAKRLDYINKINAIRTKVDTDMDTYKTELNKQFSAQLAEYRNQLTSKAEEDIKKYQRRIDVLDEMISDEYPETGLIKNLFHENSTEVADEDCEHLTVVEETEDALICHNDQNEETIIDKEALLEEDQIEEIEVPSNDAQTITVDETVLVANDMDLDISDDSLNVEHAAVTLERPGMSTIDIPSRF